VVSGALRIPAAIGNRVSESGVNNISASHHTQHCIIRNNNGASRNDFESMEKAKMDELCAFSEVAYSAEMAHDWNRAHDLHESAITKWSEFSNTTVMASTRQDHYRRMAVQKCALHRERIDVIRPFAKEGKPPSTILPVHPSTELIKKGVWDQLDLGAGPLSPSQLGQRMPLTLVRISRQP